MTRQQWAVFLFVVVVGIAALVWYKTRDQPPPYQAPPPLTASESQLAELRDEAYRAERELSSCRSDLSSCESGESSCKSELSDKEDDLSDCEHDLRMCRLNSN